MKALFICTGNIFRSMTAEYAFRVSLSSDDGSMARSAGLIDAPHPVMGYVRDFLHEKGADISNHKPQVLSVKLLRDADLAVAMGTEHREKIAQLYQRKLPLFSEVAYGTEEAMLDVHQVVPDWQNNEQESSAYAREVMNYIFQGMPAFIERMNEFVPSAKQ